MDNTNENLIESTKAEDRGRKRKLEEDDGDFINTVETRKIKVEENTDEDPTENDEDDCVATFFGIKRKLDEIIQGLRENVENTDIRWRETGDLLRDCMDDVEVHEFKIDADKEENECEDKMDDDKLVNMEKNRNLDEDKENMYPSCNNTTLCDAPSADSIKIEVEQEWNAVESDCTGKVFEDYFEEQRSLENTLVQEFLDLLDNIKEEINENENNENSVAGLRSRRTSICSTETLKCVGLEETPQDTPQNEKTTDNSVEPEDSSILGLESQKMPKDTIGSEEASSYSPQDEQTIDNSVEPKEISKGSTELVTHKRPHSSKKRKSEDLMVHEESKRSRKSDENSPKRLDRNKQSEYDKLETEGNRSTVESKKRKSSCESEIKSSKIPENVSPSAESKRSPKDKNHSNTKAIGKKQNDEPELTKIQEILLSPIRNIATEKTPSRTEEEPTTKIGAQETEIADVKPTAKELSLSEEIYKAKTKSNENDNRPALPKDQPITSSPNPRNAIRQLREVAFKKGSSDVLLPGYTYGEKTSREFAKRNKFSENSFEDLEDNEMAWCFANRPSSSSNSINELSKRTVCFVKDTNVVPETFAQPTTSKSNNTSATKATKPVHVQTTPKVNENKKKKKKRSRYKNNQAEFIVINKKNQPSCSGYQPNNQPKKKRKIFNKPPAAQALVVAQSKKTKQTNCALNTMAQQLVNTLTEINSGRSVAIVLSNYPQGRLTVSQADLITEEISRMLDQIPYGSEVPRFNNTRYSEGILWVQCADVYATRWLVCVVPGVKPWPGASLRTWNNDDKDNNSNKIPKLKKMSISISGTLMTTVEILQRLERQNRGLSTQLWIVYLRDDGDHYVTLTVGVDSTSHRQIKEMDYVAYVGLGRAFFKEIL